MKIIKSELKDVLIIEPVVFGDHRGFFMETYNRRRYVCGGVEREFVQDNFSYSGKDILRGLHFQLNHPQAKLVQVLQGDVFDVILDIRVGSPDFGRWTGVHLSGENKRQIYIPEGFAHGFCVTSESAMFLYKCSDFYNPADENGILWSDPDLQIPWPVKTPLLSDKDKIYQRLKDIPKENLPSYNKVG